MPYNYRNKVSLKIDNGKIGYYEEMTHNITNINKCLLASPPINKTIELLPLLNIKNALVTIRSNYQDEVLLIINTKEKLKNIPSIFEEHINLKGIILNDKLIYGNNSFEEIINDLKYQVSYNSFFQVNPYITKELFKIVTNHLEKDDIVYDLYCGVGAISLQAAKKVKQVIGIEVVKNAVINAVKNKKLNNINNAEFLLHDLKKEFKTTIIPNTIIIDPPRGGIDKKTMEWIINIQPKKIIYISCNPNTLVRDIKLLNNYTKKEISILDMFSYTHHCESVCILERR